jgi:hypothetical protein
VERLVVEEVVADVYKELHPLKFDESGDALVVVVIVVIEVRVRARLRRC